MDEYAKLQEEIEEENAHICHCMHDLPHHDWLPSGSVYCPQCDKVCYKGSSDESDLIICVGDVDGDDEFCEACAAFSRYVRGHP